MSIVLDGSNQTTGGLINAGTAQASTSGTYIDFTGIPSTAKRITVMFNGVSYNSNANPLIQIGSGSIVTTGYTSAAGDYVPTANFTSSTIGFVLAGTTNSIGVAANNLYGQIVLTNMNNNLWCSSSNLSGYGGSTCTATGAGTITLSGALDRVRITSVAGTATFDAGSINIFWE